MRKIVVNMERGIVDGVYSNDPCEVDFRQIEGEDRYDECRSQEYWRNKWLIEHGCYVDITGECEKVNRDVAKQICRLEERQLSSLCEDIGNVPIDKIAFLEGFLAAWGSLNRFVTGIDCVENEEKRDKFKSVYQLLSPLLDAWEQQYDTLYEELWTGHSRHVIEEEL